VQEFSAIDADGKELMRTAVRQLELSARAYHRVLKLARTFTKWAQSAIADLAGEAEIRTEHLAEALQYRPRGGV
jgi:magnesium chelatase family protein